MYLPGEGYLRHGGLVPLSERFEDGSEVWGALIFRHCCWMPRREDHSSLFCRFQECSGRTDANIVVCSDRSNIDDLTCLVELRGADVGKPNVFNQPFFF